MQASTPSESSATPRRTCSQKVMLITEPQGNHWACDLAKAFTRTGATVQKLILQPSGWEERWHVFKKGYLPLSAEEPIAKRIRDEVNAFRPQIMLYLIPTAWMPPFTSHRTRSEKTRQATGLVWGLPAYCLEWGRAFRNHLLRRFSDAGAARKASERGTTRALLFTLGSRYRSIQTRRGEHRGEPVDVCRHLDRLETQDARSPASAGYAHCLAGASQG